MADMNKVVNRRKHERFTTSTGVSVCFASSKTKTGQVADIGLGGLRIHCHGHKNAVEPWQWRLQKTLLPMLGGFYNISITVDGEACGLTHMPCETIVGSKNAVTNHFRNGKLKCLKFGPLRHEQLFHLRKLIQNHTVEPVSDRRQLTDRRRRDITQLPDIVEKRQWWRNRRAAPNPF